MHTISVASDGQIVVAGIPGEEATVKRWKRKGAKVILEPANPRLSPMTFRADEVRLYGEALSDYNRSASHVRLGVAFTR